MARHLSLILGGVRSGKSEFAEKLASELNKPTLYVATGLPTDAEMEQRIRRHQQARPKHWDTVEETIDLAGCLESALSNDERFGIWGGLSERERRKLKKRAV